MGSSVIDAGDDLPLSVPALLRRQSRLYGDRTLVVCDNERLTYAQADARSRLIARGMLAAGAGKGSIVALLLPNGADFVVCALAASRIGAVVAPLSTLSTGEELRWLLANSDTAFLFAAPGYRSRSYAETVREALPDLDFSRPPPLASAHAPWLRRVWFTGTAPEGVHPGWSITSLEAMAHAVDDSFLEAIEARVTPADRFFIIHTSGSTSKPKGVVHSQGAMLRYCDNLNRLRKYGADVVLYSPSPWFWVAGLGYALFSIIVAGGRLVVSNAAAASDILDLMEREKPDAANGWPAAAERLAADPSFAGRDMSFIRRGNLYAIMAPDIKPRDPELRHQVYGMTEAGGTFTHFLHENDAPEHQRGAFGPLVPGYEGKIVDPETGATLEPNETGELWVRGTFLMEGYYGKHRSEVFEPDGWFRTGDLGRFDADGLFYFKGRRGDMIKTAGANVAPREVEAVMRDLVGPLTPCVVMGVPDRKRGQRVVAVVVAEDGADVDEQSLKQKLSSKLSSYKVPRHILRIAPAELPMLSSGKINMRALVELVRGRLPESDAASQ